jgi:hypothetical protein
VKRKESYSFSWETLVAPSPVLAICPLGWCIFTYAGLNRTI